MTIVPLVYCARHMFVDLPEGRWLVDTGSPITFGTPGKITWDGATRTVPRAIGGVTMEDIQRHIDTPLVGLIGLDLLNAQDSCWDGPAGEMRIGDGDAPADSVSIEFESFMGVPVVQPSIMGRHARCIFDTGAQYGYVISEGLEDGGADDGQMEDFNPQLGRIQSPAWLVQADLAGIQFNERVGRLPGAAAMLFRSNGIDAVIGCSWLPTRRVWYRPMAKRINVWPAR